MNGIETPDNQNVFIELTQANKHVLVYISVIRLLRYLMMGLYETFVLLKIGIDYFKNLIIVLKTIKVELSKVT